MTVTLMPEGIQARIPAAYQEMIPAFAMPVVNPVVMPEVILARIPPWAIMR